jgi:hypothetical protein
MIRPAPVTVAAVFFAALGSALPAGAEDLDCTANPRLLETHFGRYGYSTAKTITREPQGVLHFRLPAHTEGVGQTGIYSYVKIDGDFEVSASYDWIDVTMPKIGYGASCGIAIDSGDRGVMVSLARSHFAEPDKGPGYGVTVGKSLGTKVDYDTKYYYSKAKRGRLVLRREKGEVICLTADGSKDPLEERQRVPLTQAVGQVRFFADAGGSPTLVDARLGQMRVQADEITGGFAKSEQPWTMPWWAIVAMSLFGVTVVLVLVRQRLLRQWPWSAGGQ